MLENTRRIAVALTMATALTAPAFAADALKVGYVTGLTGACAPISEDGLNGTKIAVQEINARGGVLGRQIELLVRDSQTKPEEGGKQARELAAAEKVELLTGVCSSAVLLAVNAVAGEFKIPHSAIIGSTQKANIEAFHPYFWQTQANATMEAIAAAEYVAKKAEWKRITPMGYDYEWGHTSVDAFVGRLKELRPDIEIANPVFTKVGEANMGPYITAALNSQPDAIFAAVFGGGLVSLIRQGESFGMFKRSNLVTLLTVDTLQSMGDAMPKERVFGIARAPFFALDQTPELAAFIDSYRAAYNEYPTDWAINGYDAMKFYAEAVEKAGTTGADAVMKVVHETAFDGLRGKALKTRAFDGQMNVPAYVGEVNFDPAFPFPTMKNVEIFAGDSLMFSEEVIQSMRDAAK
ncbi:ABC transporter substrate-binding protein [Ruixingdingia sedimenti]|uniref:ABC transporter substrate-binding protein n=1 Tax=Ruixingdingia sedimenti TaxID=3073604 RepID=A0ABU1FBE9_9RHOB|nr:ABC transporter substrate-binding protein [Xinfangfangia sp. LG-4]MDR5653769.1 ABC transporter substrate-binding protein [Xinfangfangia sp. LG-4]